MDLNIKKSFDQYFDLDYDRLAWSTAELSEALNTLKPINDKKEKFKRLQQFIKFYDNYASIKHPETEQKCLQLFGFNYSDINHDVLKNKGKRIYRFINPESREIYYNGTEYLLKKWHDLRSVLCSLEFEKIDRYTSKSVFNGMIYDELPFFYAYYNTIVDFKDGDGFIRVNKSFSNSKNLKNYETLLDCFLTNSTCNAVLDQSLHKEGNVALVKLLTIRVMQLEEQKNVA